MYSITKAKICNVRDLENSDNLVIGEANGYKVIVGKEVKEGDGGILFLDGMQIGTEFAELHDLIEKRDENNLRINKGYFDENRRVRNIKLRGTKTEAFWIKHESDEEIIFEPDRSRYFLGKLFLGKPYRIKRQQVPGEPKPLSNRREVAGIRRHYDTCPLKLAIRQLNDEKHDRIIVTEKLHGTSMRVAKIFVENERPWYLKWFFKILLKLFNYKDGAEKVIVGTRNCLIGPEHKDQYRFEIADLFASELKVGECVYGEIVGWNDSVPIMPFAPLSRLKSNKKNRAEKHATWVYGCEEGRFDVYVYRITQDDVDLPWEEVELRCLSLGLKTVPVILESDNQTLKIDEENEVLLVGEIPVPIGGRSVFEDVEYKEGLCIRFEKTEEIPFLGTAFVEKTFKLKSWQFGVLEGYIKDDGVSNVEEES